MQFEVERFIRKNVLSSIPLVTTVKVFGTDVCWTEQEHVGRVLRTAAKDI